MGKGSGRRPADVDDRQLEFNWAQTFDPEGARDVKIECTRCGGSGLLQTYANGVGDCPDCTGFGYTIHQR